MGHLWKAAKYCRSSHPSRAFLGFAASAAEPQFPTQRTPMKYVFLIYETPADFAIRQQGEQTLMSPRGALTQSARRGGAFVGGAPLKEIATATTVRMRNGKQSRPGRTLRRIEGAARRLHDPQSCLRSDEALSWAARCPAASTGLVEVRPMEVGMHDVIVKP